MSRSRAWTAPLAAFLRDLAGDIRKGRLLSEQPHNVDMCTCCDGDPRLRRCDDLWKSGGWRGGRLPR